MAQAFGNQLSVSNHGNQEREVNWFYAAICLHLSLLSDPVWELLHER